MREKGEERREGEEKEKSDGLVFEHLGFRGSFYTVFFLIIIIIIIIIRLILFIFISVHFVARSN